MHPSALKNETWDVNIFLIFAPIEKNLVSFGPSGDVPKHTESYAESPKHDKVNIFVNISLAIRDSTVH